MCSFTTPLRKGHPAWRPIFSMSSSFHKSEPGFEHQLPCGGATPRGSSQSQGNHWWPDETRCRRACSYWSRERPIDMRGGRCLALPHARQENPPVGHLDQGQRAPARRSGVEITRLCIGFHTPRHRADCSRQASVRRGCATRQPRPCSLVPPSSRRVAAVCAGQPQCHGARAAEHLDARDGVSPLRGSGRAHAATAVRFYCPIDGHSPPICPKR